MNTKNKPFPKAGEVVTGEIYVHCHKDGGKLYLAAFDMSEFGHACFGSVEVTFTMPGGDPISAMVAALENQIEKENAYHHVKVNQLKGRIQELLAIGHDGGCNE